MSVHPIRGLLILVILVSVGRTSAAIANSPKKVVVQRVIRSSAWVLMETGTGSAWIYDKESKILVTNFHVVANFTKQSNPGVGEEQRQVIYDKIVLVFPTYRGKDELITERKHYLKNFDQLEKERRIVNAEVIHADMKRDLAVLRAASIPDDILALPLAVKSQDQGEAHFSIGNPGAADHLWLFTGGKVKGGGHQEWRSGGGHLFLHHEAKVLLTEGQTNHGDSGGPVVNEDGELVGVTQGGAATAAAINYAIDVEEVRAYLKEVAMLFAPCKTADDYFLRGLYYLGQGRPALAERHFLIALQVRNDRSRATRQACLLNLATAKREQGDYFSAVEFCEKVLAEDGGAGAREFAERAASRLKMIPILAFLPAVPRAPLGRPLQLSDGLEKYFAAQKEAQKVHDQFWNPRKNEVLDDITRALKKDPNCELAYRTRASFYRRLWNTEKEIEDRSHVVRILKGFDQPLLERAEAYYLAGKLDEAIADCAEALKLTPKSLLAQQRMSEFQLKKGNLKEAVIAGLAAADLEPENPVNWVQLAQILKVAKYYKEVVAALTRAMQSNERDLGKPPKRQHYVERGDAYAALKLYEEARADYLRALKIKPSIDDSDILALGGYSKQVIEKRLRDLPAE